MVRSGALCCGALGNARRHSPYYCALVVFGLVDVELLRLAPMAPLRRRGPRRATGTPRLARPPRAGARRRGGARRPPCRRGAGALPRARGRRRAVGDVGALPLVAVVGIVANTIVALLSADNSRALCGGPPHAAVPATNTARAKAKAAKAKAMKGRKKSSFDAATDALDEMVGDGGMTRRSRWSPPRATCSRSRSTSAPLRARRTRKGTRKRRRCAAGATGRRQSPVRR